MGHFNQIALRALGAAVTLLGTVDLIACQSISGLADYKEGPPLDAGADSADPDSGFETDDAGLPKGSNPAQWAQFRLACGANEGCGLAEPPYPETGNFYDSTTGITWVAADAKSAATFGDAIAACAPNRLPTRMELVSLLRRPKMGRGWEFPQSLQATLNVFWTASVSYPIDPVKPRFWSVNRLSAEVRPGLPGPGDGLSKWSVLCISK